MTMIHQNSAESRVSSDEMIDHSEDEYDDDDNEDMDINHDNSNVGKGNPSWADVFQKILKTNKPIKKKSLVLSRAKKLPAVPSTSSIPSAKSDIKADVDVQETKEKKVKGRVKLQHASLRRKPSVLDRGREKILQTIATKGIIQLFNAVERQQAIINKKLETAGPLERKQEQVLRSIDKRAFLDMLMGNTKSIPVNDSLAEAKVEKDEDDKEAKVWSVLRDDFVMGAKLKDWDKKVDDEEMSSDADEVDN